MPESEGRFLDEWAEPLIFGALAVACLVIFGQTIGFDFINLDDHSYVYLNPVITSGINTESITWAFTAFHSSNWHPVTWLSHAFDVQLFGLNAGAHHAVNVILHLVNSCLVFIVFRSYTGSVWKSAVVAMLFAIHPAHVESVAWISERKDVLSTLFWLLTMLVYGWYAGSDASEGSIVKRFVTPRYILALALFALGLMAKPMLVTLPFVLILMDVWPLDRVSTIKQLVPAFVEKLPFIALAALSSIITFMAQQSSGAVLGLERFPIESRIVNSVTAYVKYIIVMFYPADLGVWYPFEPQISTSVFIASIAALLGISAAALWQLRKRPFIAVGWFWFIGTLVPVIGLVQVGAQSMADRYTYIPYLGLFLIVVWGSAELINRFQIDVRVAAAIGLIAIVILGYVAFVQAGFWKNSETLYTRTIAVTKENYFLMNLLCRYYIDKTPVANAERRCTELLDHTSNYLEAHNTIGLLRVELGRYEDALVSYRKALQIRPNAAIVYANMAVAYAKKGDTEAAEKHLLRAVEIGGQSLTRDALAYCYNALGEAYVERNDAPRARTAFQTALRYEPKFEAAQTNLAKLQGGS